MFRYGKAGSNAPPEVKHAINRFHKLPEKDKSKQNLWQWLLGNGTQDYKVSQKDSEYTDKATGEDRCENCRFAYLEWDRQEFICSEIQDDIKLAGWCDRFKKGDSLKKAIDNWKKIDLTGER